jgi:phosphoserine phosphatase
VGAPDWLATDIACDIPFDGPPTGVAMTALDGIVVPVEGRRKKLLVADMESTVIENEMLDELADFLGLREKIAGITARAMNGEIDFAGALAERVGLLKGLPVARLDEAARRIRYTPGGATLVATMKKHGAYCALVSGGFTHFTALVKQALGFDSDAANILKHDGHTLLGTVEPPILGKEAKLATLERLAVGHGLSANDSLSVGDGANDLPMLGAAGLGVAFHAKPAVAAQVPSRIDHGDLTALLYLQGYRLTDFVERKDP